MLNIGKQRFSAEKVRYLVQLVPSVWNEEILSHKNGKFGKSWTQKCRSFREGICLVPRRVRDRCVNKDWLKGNLMYIFLKKSYSGAVTAMDLFPMERDVRLMV